MKNIRTYEGFFDFFKKKNYYSITIEQILDCLLPITSDLLDGYGPDGTIIANPLYKNDDEKMDFDAVILDILRYAVSEGYKYKCEEIESYSKEVIRYSIYLYKEKITTYK